MFNLYLMSKIGVNTDGSQDFDEKQLLNIPNENMEESYTLKISHRVLPGGSYEAYLSKNGEIKGSHPYQSSSFNYHHFRAAPFLAWGYTELVSFRYQQLSEDVFEQQSEIAEIEPENKTDLFSPHNHNRLPFYETCKRTYMQQIKKLIIK